MRLHGLDAALFGKVGGLFDVGDSRGACPARDQTNRERPLIEVPNFFSWSSDDQRRSLNLVLLERLTQSADKIQLKLIHKDLACG